MREETPERRYRIGWEKAFGISGDHPPRKELGETHDECEHAYNESPFSPRETSAPIQTNPTIERAGKAKEAHDKPSPRWRLAEGLGILAAVVVAVVNVYQWRDAAKHFQIDERAWVGVINMIIHSGDKTTTPALNTTFPEELVAVGRSIPSIGVAVRNSGKTPALKVTIRMESSIRLSSVEFKPEFIITKGQLPKTYLVQPGTEVSTELPPSPGAPDQQYFTGLRNGVIYYCIFGDITYEDIFHQKHWTHFCMRLSPMLNEFINCPAYNETDDD